MIAVELDSMAKAYEALTTQAQEDIVKLGEKEDQIAKLIGEVCRFLEFGLTIGAESKTGAKGNIPQQASYYPWKQPNCAEKTAGQAARVDSKVWRNGKELVTAIGLFLP